MFVDYGKSLKRVLQLIHSMALQNKNLLRASQYLLRAYKFDWFGHKRKITHFENYKKDVQVRRGTEIKR